MMAFLLYLLTAEAQPVEVRIVKSSNVWGKEKEYAGTVFLFIISNPLQHGASASYWKGK